MKSLCIFCDGGLGNRLSTLISGLIIADTLKRTPIIYWPANTWCGVDFFDIFNTQHAVSNLNINETFHEHKDGYCLIHENQTNLNLPKQLYPDRQNIDALKNCNDPQVLYYNNAIPDFINEEDCVKILKTLIIKNHIIEEVQEFCTKHDINKNVFGIHLRKTDYGNLIDESFFEDKIKNSLDRFFVCSDDQNTELRYKKYYNVITRQKQNYVDKLNILAGWNDSIIDMEGRQFRFNVNRTRAAVIDGFIDMLVLAKTTIIVDSISSFLKLSKIYSKIYLD